jgi:hypothetical protein
MTLAISDLAKMTAVAMYDPSAVAQSLFATYDRLSINGGDISFVDPNNPFVLALTNQAILASTMAEQAADLNRKLYSSQAVTQEDLYHHMSDKEVELQTIGGDNNRSKVQLANMQFVISKRLIADLPLVPTNNLIYSLVDDMQVGLYDDLGSIDDCDANWNEWLQRTVDILQAEGYLGSNSIMINRPAITTTASAKDNIIPFIMEMFEDQIPTECII